MGVLDVASSNSIYRGYDYYESDKVVSFEKISDYIYEGLVQGSADEPYFVSLNVKHPKKSYCTCPFADGNRVCKHMVALYLYAFPSEADELKEELFGCYDEEDDYFDDEYYDEEDYGVHYHVNGYNHERFVKPLIFDELLTDFVSNLSVEELKRLLISELNKDEERTFNLYLKDLYVKRLNNKQDDWAFVESLHNKFEKFTASINYDFYNFSDTLLTNHEKHRIKEIFYQKSKALNSLKDVLMNPSLAVYNQYQWIAEFLLYNLTYPEIQEYIKQLELLLSKLKSYRIRNSIPKSNVLICLYIMNLSSLDDLAFSLLKNAKYFEYVRYVFEKEDITKELFYAFKKCVDKHGYHYQENVAEVYLQFCLKFVTDRDINIEYVYHAFVSHGNCNVFDVLHDKEDVPLIEERLVKNKRTSYLLPRFYAYFKRYDDLFKWAYDGQQNHILTEYVVELSDKYSNQLYNRFENCFYTMIAKEKSRDIYRQAAKYVVAISKIDGSLYDKFMLDLSCTSFNNRPAMFDEIYKAINSSKSKLGK